MTIGAKRQRRVCGRSEKSLVAGKVGYAVIPKTREYGINLSLHSLYVSLLSEQRTPLNASSGRPAKKPKLKRCKLNLFLPASKYTWSLPEYAEKYSVFMDAHFESVEKSNLAYVPTLPEIMGSMTLFPYIRY